MRIQTQLARRRQKRTWAPTTDTIATLSRSARQLARNSASTLSLPAVAECMRKYQYVSAMERACKLIRGDLLVMLIDGHGLRAIDIGRVTGERPSDLSQMYSVAKTFPRRFRPEDARYNHLLMAMRVTRRFPTLGMTANDAYDEIVGSGLTQHRDVTRHFSTLTRRIVSSKVRRLTDQRLVPGLLDHAHHCRFQDLRSAFADRSIQIFSLDPPYVYGDDTYGSRSARSLACDNDDPASAVAMVIDALRDWQEKLATGGVLLLWQPWQSMLPEIAQAIERYRWEVVGPIVWDKGRPQPGHFDSPYSVQGEFLWVLHRPGDRLVNHDGSPRHSILRFAPVSCPGASADQVHCFEKPESLCEFLIRKHSRRGDIIFDACGCTGAMSAAAIRLGRRWVYAESNAENHQLGSERIKQTLAASSQASGVTCRARLNGGLAAAT